MSDGYNVQNFKIGSCALTFKEQVLGGTQTPPQIKIEPQLYESKCDQSGGLVLREIVTGMKVTISAELKEIDKAFAVLLDNGDELNTAIIGTDLRNRSGLLRLTPVNPDDHTGYEFPNAVMRPGCTYRLDGNQEHVLAVEFTAHPDQAGVIMKKIAIGG